MSPLQLLGLGLVIAAVVRALWALRLPAAAELRRRRRRLVDAGRLRHRLEQALAAHFAWRERGLAWKGLRELVVVRAEREDPIDGDAAAGDTDDGVADADDEAVIRSLYLAPRDGKALPSFRPGQYLTLHLPATEPGTSAIRCYALSDLPRPDYYRVTIKARPGDAATRASAWLVANASSGLVVPAEAPRGAFVFQPDPSRPTVFIAGGIGITAVACLLRGALQAAAPGRFFLYYGTRDGRRHLMREELERLARSDDLGLHVRYSRPRPADLAGRDYARPGRVDVELLRATLPGPDCDFYLCAPPAMLTSLVAGLRAWGVSERRLHAEVWGAESLRGISDADHDDAPIEVTFRRTGKVCRWNPESASLLDFAEENGVAMTAGCRAGNCGACLTATSGSFRYLRDPGAIPSPGTCLTCIAVPEGPVEVDA